MQDTSKFVCKVCDKEFSKAYATKHFAGYHSLLACIVKDWIVQKDANLIRNHKKAQCVLKLCYTAKEDDTAQYHKQKSKHQNLTNTTSQHTEANPLTHNHTETNISNINEHNLSEPKTKAHNTNPSTVKQIHTEPTRSKPGRFQSQLSQHTDEPTSQHQTTSRTTPSQAEQSHTEPSHQRATPNRPTQHLTKHMNIFTLT